MFGHQRPVDAVGGAVRLQALVLPGQRQARFERPFAPGLLAADGDPLGAQALDVGGLHHGADAVAALRLGRREEDVGVGGLLLLLDTQAGVQLPGLAEEVGRLEIGFDAGAGVGTDAGTEGQAMRRALAQTDGDRRGDDAVGIRRRVAVDADLHRAELRRRLQGRLQRIEVGFAEGLAGAHRAVVALDQRHRVALQALDPQLAEAEGRTAVVAGHQPCLPGCRIDRRLAVDEAGRGMVFSKQARQDLLLGGVPVLLAKRLADRQLPAGDQFLPRFCRQRAVDRNIHRGDHGARAGLDGKTQVAIALRRIRSAARNSPRSRESG